MSGKGYPGVFLGIAWDHGRALQWRGSPSRRRSVIPNKNKQIDQAAILLSSNDHVEEVPGPQRSQASEHSLVRNFREGSVVKAMMVGVVRTIGKATGKSTG